MGGRTLRCPMAEEPLTFSNALQFSDEIPFYDRPQSRHHYHPGLPSSKDPWCSILHLLVRSSTF